MKFLRTLHLYLGCLFAPVLIFFAVSGAWQVFKFHEAPKGGGYTPPRALVTLSEIHKEGHFQTGLRNHATPLRYFFVVAAAGLVTTTVLGVIMAFRFSQKPIVASVCLLLGVALPAVILWTYH